MGVFDDLTSRERAMIVKALRLMPTETLSEAEELAGRIESAALADQMEKFVQRIRDDTDRQTAAMLTGTIASLKGMCESLADGLGGLVALMADSDAEQYEHVIAGAREALALWQDARTHIDGLLRAIEDG